MVTKNDITKKLREIGITHGDTILVHSSFKSLGELENGADTVISAIFDVIGTDGTLCFPTLCQKDWMNVYKNWHIDAPSDVGYLTNYFRKLPEAKRSNQATHSVAAIGKNAGYLTATHGENGKRYGLFGTTPFSADSPWEKLYHQNAKILYLGVEPDSCTTFCHYVEYCFMEKILKKLETSKDYEALLSRVRSYEEWEKRGAWPYTESSFVCDILKKEGKIKSARLNDCKFTVINSADYVDTSMKTLENENFDIIEQRKDVFINWYEDAKKAMTK